MKLLCISFLVVQGVLSLSDNINPLSDEFINHLNSIKGITWTAGRNFDENTSLNDLKKLVGAKRGHPSLRILPANDTEDTDIPDSFDARVNWPECTDVISQISDQSACGSCWAVSSANAMSDRLCIASKGKIKRPVSAINIISCCYAGVYGCDGGYPDSAFEQWRDKGIVTGGLYGSSEGCQPYPFQPCEHHINGSKVSCSSLDYNEPDCKEVCDNPKLNYENDKTYATNVYNIVFDIKGAQKEILEHGSIVTTYTVYDDFFNYKSGVYQYQGGYPMGEHAVRVIGWGEENGTPYWLVANSWNEEWGDHGTFKIIRGRNEGNFEYAFVAGTPKV